MSAAPWAGLPSGGGIVADWISARDRRLRIVAAVLFACCVVLLQRPLPLLLAFVVLLTAALLLFDRLPVGLSPV